MGTNRKWSQKWNKSEALKHMNRARNPSLVEDCMVCHAILLLMIGQCVNVPLWRNYYSFFFFERDNHTGGHWTYTRWADWSLKSQKVHTGHSTCPRWVNWSLVWQKWDLILSVICLFLYRAAEMLFLYENWHVCKTHSHVVLWFFFRVFWKYFIFLNFWKIPQH